MHDDPYLSLVWFVQEKGGIAKDIQYVDEYKWYDFFKTEINKPIKEVSANFKSVLEEAVLLAKSDKAKDLPGFIKENIK